MQAARLYLSKTSPVCMNMLIYLSLILLLPLLPLPMLLLHIQVFILLLYILVFMLLLHIQVFMLLLHIQVFDSVGRNAVEALFDEKSALLFAYGMTSSGTVLAPCFGSFFSKP